MIGGISPATTCVHPRPLSSQLKKKWLMGNKHFSTSGFYRPQPQVNHKAVFNFVINLAHLLLLYALSEGLSNTGSSSDGLGKGVLTLRGMYLVEENYECFGSYKICILTMCLARVLFHWSS